MANNRISIRRTSTSGKIPTLSDINTGELGLNLTDGILYSSNGSHVFEIGIIELLEVAKGLPTESEAIKIAFGKYKIKSRWKKK